MPKGRVLVADDDADIIRLIRTYLEADGYEVISAANGDEALVQVRTGAPDVIILDLMMPQTDGLTVLREVRKARMVPILILSARNDDVDKILGLEMGADDYLTKPFNTKELVARVHAMFRRIQAAPEPADEVLVRKHLKVMVGQQRVTVDGHDVHLTPVEFALLRALVAANGLVLSRQDLLNKAWGAEYVGEERNVDTHIRHIRTKLQNISPGPRYISAVWRVGYKLDI
jgi:DNA-binding response OmpR family regulator